MNDLTRSGRLGLSLACGLAMLGAVVVQSLPAAAPKPKLGLPTVVCGDSAEESIQLTVTADATTGAPAGFSIQWMSLDDFTANGNSWFLSDDPRLCKASFSGNASDSNYSLGPGGTATVTVGDILFDNGASTSCANALLCGTTYVFRSFAHATSSRQRSDFTADVYCSTADCPDVCGALSQGYWRNHPDNWPTAIVLAGGLQIGSHFYDLTQLQFLLETHPVAGTKFFQLVHQVIAVEFSIAEFGAVDGADLACLADAHAAIGDATYNITTKTLPNGNIQYIVNADDVGDVGALIACLDLGYIQAYHCDSYNGDEDPIPLPE